MASVAYSSIQKGSMSDHFSMGQNIGVTLQRHWILLAGYIEATDEILHIFFPPSSF